MENKTKIKINPKNELIAKFMGGIFYPKGNIYKFPNAMKILGGGNKCHSTFINLYETSWDWLMPVVVKIHDIAPEDVKEINNEGLAIFELGLTTPINEVYNAVIEFINWDTQNNSKND